MNSQPIKILTLAIIFCLVNFNFLNAQTSATEGAVIKKQPGQITFISPFGTNGKAADQTINNFSLNVLYGSSAGVSGIELGGLLNQTYGSIFGAQFSGLGNFSTGTLTGGQFAGLINTSLRFNGLQMAGLLNIASERPKVAEELASAHSSKGAQISGLLNINSIPLNGVQGAGLLNLNASSIKGIQVAGLINTSKHVKGVQVSGLLNKTKTLSGVQIGLINFADTIKKGVQIGLINIAKDGYRTTEIESNESFYANVNYKMGTKRLYTIFAISFTEKSGNQFWAPGFGFGTYLSLSKKAGLNIDAISYQVNENQWWTNELNQLIKLKINGSIQLANHFTLYGGVSVNTLISGIDDAEGNTKGSLLKVHHTFYDEVHRNNRIMIYPGVNAGIRF